MSSTQQIGILIGIQNILKTINETIKSALNTLTVKLSNEIRSAANLLTKAILTGTRMGQTGKGVGKSQLGQDFGVTKIGDLFTKLNEYFKPIPQIVKQVGQSAQPNLKTGWFGSVGAGQVISPQRMQAIQQSIPQPTGGFKKIFGSMGKMLKGVFGNVGKSLFASFGPMMLLFQMLSPLIQAFLEPLDLMTPLFESWGTILSQLLIPIILSLMDILMPFTPVLEALVQLLLPILDIIPAIISWIVPLIEIITTGATGIISAVSVVVTFIMGAVNTGISFIGEYIAAIAGFFINISEKFTAFFQWAISWASDLWEGIIDKFRGVGNRIKRVFGDIWDDIVETIRDKFNVFSGGGLDNNPDTWW